MTDKEASEYLSSKKIRHCVIKRIAEGANHFVFDVKLDNGEQVIARFRSGDSRNETAFPEGIFQTSGGIQYHMNPCNRSEMKLSDFT